MSPSIESVLSRNFFASSLYFDLIAKEFICKRWIDGLTGPSPPDHPLLLPEPLLLPLPPPRGRNEGGCGHQDRSEEGGEAEADLIQCSSEEVRPDRQDGLQPLRSCGVSALDPVGAGASDLEGGDRPPRAAGEAVGDLPRRGAEIHPLAGGEVDYLDHEPRRDPLPSRIKSTVYEASVLVEDGVVADLLEVEFGGPGRLDLGQAVADLRYG